MPTAALPSVAVALVGLAPGASADRLDRGLRSASPPVIARIADGQVLLDVRTIAPSELAAVARAVQGALAGAFA